MTTSPSRTEAGSSFCVGASRNYPPIARPPADAIGTLSLIVDAIALLIFIGVEGALVYAILTRH